MMHSTSPSIFATWAALPFNWGSQISVVISLLANCTAWRRHDQFPSHPPRFWIRIPRKYTGKRLIIPICCLLERIKLFDIGMKVRFTDSKWDTHIWKFFVDLHDFANWFVIPPVTSLACRSTILREQCVRRIKITPLPSGGSKITLTSTRRQPEHRARFTLELMHFIQAEPLSASLVGRRVSTIS